MMHMAETTLQIC